MSTQPHAVDIRDVVARAICREDCAFRGEPPCFTQPGDWPNPECDSPGCHALATAAIEALADALPASRKALERARSDKLAARLTAAIVTASNDDYSRPGTPERRRHVERIDAMDAARDYLQEDGE